MIPLGNTGFSLVSLKWPVHVFRVKVLKSCQPSSQHNPSQGLLEAIPQAKPYLFPVQFGIGPWEEDIGDCTNHWLWVGFWFRGRQEPFHWLTASTMPTSLMISSWPLDMPKVILVFLDLELRVASKEESWWPTLKDPRFFKWKLFLFFMLYKRKHWNPFYFLALLIPTQHSTNPELLPSQQLGSFGWGGEMKRE